MKLSVGDLQPAVIFSPSFADRHREETVSAPETLRNVPSCGTPLETIVLPPARNPLTAITPFFGEKSSGKKAPDQLNIYGFQKIFSIRSHISGSISEGRTIKTDSIFSGYSASFSIRAISGVSRKKFFLSFFSDSFRISFYPLPDICGGKRHIRRYSFRRICAAQCGQQIQRSLKIPYFFLRFL